MIFQGMSVNFKTLSKGPWLWRTPRSSLHRISVPHSTVSIGEKWAESRSRFLIEPARSPALAGRRQVPGIWCLSLPFKLSGQFLWGDDEENWPSMGTREGVMTGMD